MEKYSLSMRIIHWLMALLIITLLAVGLWMSGLPNEYPGKYDVYALHKSFGVIALLLIVVRISVRMRSKVPALPKEINKFDTGLSAITIFVLYACMFAMPMSGYLMSTFGGHPVHLFGLELPSVVSQNPDMGKFFWNVHGYAGYVLIVFIGLHILGSLKHIAVEKVNLFKRMW
jgi:cytochrome b561